MNSKSIFQFEIRPRLYKILENHILKNVENLA
jgi:hypothetical protein